MSPSACQNSLNWVQSCALIRWSQQHRALSRLHPWEQPHCGTGGQNVHSKDRKGEGPPIPWVQFLGQLAVMSFRWPPPTKNFVRYVICKYFLQCVDFHPINRVFQISEVLTLMRFNLLILLWIVPLVSDLRTLCFPRYPKFSSIFF